MLSAVPGRRELAGPLQSWEPPARQRPRAGPGHAYQAYVRYQTGRESTFASVGLREGPRRPFGAWCSSCLQLKCDADVAGTITSEVMHGAPGIPEDEREGNPSQD